MVIGVDPDLKQSGYCEMLKSKIVDLRCLPFFLLLNEIKRNFETYGNDLTVVIECGNLNQISNYHYAANKSVAARIGKNVGENHTISKLLVEFCQINGIKYKEYKPSAKKWDAALFKKLTGYEKRNNQEMRDAVRAAMMA